MGRRQEFFFLLLLLPSLLFASPKDFRDNLLLVEEQEFRSLFCIHLQYQPSVFSPDPVFRSSHPWGYVNGGGAAFLLREQFQVTPRLELTVRAGGEMETRRKGEEALLSATGVFDLGIRYQVTENLAMGVEGTFSLATPEFPDNP